MKYAALLRGINVGGRNKIQMGILRDIFSSPGLKNIKTYINVKIPDKLPEDIDLVSGYLRSGYEYVNSLQPK